MFKYGFTVINNRITIHMYIILVKFDVFHPSFHLALILHGAVFTAWKPSKTMSELMFINMINCPS